MTSLANDSFDELIRNVYDKNCKEEEELQHNSSTRRTGHKESLTAKQTWEIPEFELTRKGQKSSQA